MTVQHTPAPVRSDLSPALSNASHVRRPYRLQGTMLSVGALSWAASQAAFGIDGDSDLALALGGLGSGLFQVGLLSLLVVLYRSRALGTGRLARFFLRAEAVLVTFATGSTIADAVQVSDLDRAGWAMLDAFWPFSMLGMFAIAVRIAIAGRWHGAARFWPLVAESWALVVIPTMGAFGSTAATVVSIVHLSVGYAVLGQIVARKQD